MIHVYIILGCLTACLAIVVGILIFVYNPMIRKYSLAVETIIQDIDDINDHIGVHGKMLEDITDLQIRDDIYVKLATLNNEVQRLKRK